MASSRKEISSAIKNILETVDGIANVHEFHRYTKTPEGYKELFTRLISQHKREMNTWLISRDTVGQRSEGVPTTQLEREHIFTIEGWIGMKDDTGSEETFQDLIDGILDTFAPRIRLGAAEVVEYVYPLQAPRIDHDWLGPFLCNHCQIQMRVLERVTIVYNP